MGRNIEICQVCLGGPTLIVWNPVKSVSEFKFKKGAKLSRHDVVVCRECMDAILFMWLSDREIFSGCQTLHDILRIVRQERLL